jgi:hypothetical protein
MTPEYSARELVKEALAAGVHPSTIRRNLQSIGIRWKYTYSGRVDGRRTQVQGTRETARRLAQQGLKRCAGCPGTFRKTIGGELCGACLEKKFGTP